MKKFQEKTIFVVTLTPFPHQRQTPFSDVSFWKNDAHHSLYSFENKNVGDVRDACPVSLSPTTTFIQKPLFWLWKKTHFAGNDLFFVFQSTTASSTRSYNNNTTLRSSMPCNMTHHKFWPNVKIQHQNPYTLHKKYVASMSIHFPTRKII